MAIKTRETTATGVTNKGSPLTNAEVDNNFVELKQDKLENISEDASPQLGADLDLNSNDITGTGNVSITGNITVSGTVDGRDVSTDGTKLDGIEAAATADQTAAEIRTLVDSATDSNVFTDADHSKLDAIEASATADQTDAEIRAAVEAASDSNVFTDADHSKLDGIEASADVTDTANVTAAGALMDSEVTNLAQVKAFDSSDYATAAQGTTADSALQNVVEDTTPQLGGNLDFNGNTATSFASTGIDDNASSTSITIDSSQNVGVGASSPSSYYATELVVSSSAEGGITLAAQGTTQTNYVAFADGTSGDARFRGQLRYDHSDDSISLVSSGYARILTGSSRTEALRVDASGNLGIGGIASPQAPLHIYKTEASVGETDPIARFERFTTGDNAYLDITVDNDNNLIGFQSTGSSDGGFTFGGAATERLKIGSDGHVLSLIHI